MQSLKTHDDDKNNDCDHPEESTDTPIACPTSVAILKLVTMLAMEEPIQTTFVTEGSLNKHKSTFSITEAEKCVDDFVANVYTLFTCNGKITYHNKNDISDFKQSLHQR